MWVVLKLVVLCIIFGVKWGMMFCEVIVMKFGVLIGLCFLRVRVFNFVDVVFFIEDLSIWNLVLEVVMFVVFLFILLWFCDVVWGGRLRCICGKREVWRKDLDFWGVGMIEMW